MADTPTRELADASHAPVECAGAICVRGDHVLLIRRGQPPRKGEWSIPGGRIEPGESPEDACVRELTEETGVTGAVAEEVEIIDTAFDGIPYRLHDYALFWVAGEPVAADDAADARWFTREEARTLGVWPKTLEVVERALDLLGGAGQP